MRILNFTQHTATADQLDAGVVEPESPDKQEIQSALTFTHLPTTKDLRMRAIACAFLAKDLMAKYGCDAAMIGGAPFFMSHLEAALRSLHIPFCYAFSERVAEDQIQPDGSVKKVAVFKHVGFIFPEDEP